MSNTISFTLHWCPHLIWLKSGFDYSTLIISLALVLINILGIFLIRAFIQPTRIDCCYFTVYIRG